MGEWVKLPAFAVERIRALQEQMGGDAEPLFRSASNNSRGAPLTAGSVYRIVRWCAQATGLLAEVPALGAHTMRHTGCTLAVEAGASVKQVQAHARHKDVATTMVYIHRRERLRDSAADYIRVWARSKSRPLTSHPTCSTSTAGSRTGAAC